MRKISEKKRKRKRRSSSDIMDEFIDESLRPDSSPKKRKRRSSSGGSSHRKKKVHKPIEMPDIVDKSLLGRGPKTTTSQKKMPVETEAVIQRETRRSRIKKPELEEFEDSLRDRSYDKKKKGSFVDGVIGILLVAVFVSMVIFYVKVDRAEVISGSMEPTLMTNEKVIIINGRSPKRFQMVVFYPPDGSKDKYVKRIIGLPGDTIEYRDDVLYVNGEMYEEPYLDKNRENFEAEANSETEFYTKDLNLENIPGVAKGTKKIPKDMFLVLGDNRQNSQDSRYIGLIPKDNLVGIVWKKAQEPKKITN